MLTKQEFDQLKLDLKKKVDKKAILKLIEQKYTQAAEEVSSFLPPKGQEHVHKIHGNTMSSPFEKKRGVKIATQATSERGDASKGINPSIGA